MKQLLTIAACIFFIVKAGAQSVAINTDGSTAAASALLEVKSTEKGILIPRMSKAQKNAIATPATGLMIYQNAPDSTGFYYYNGTAWLWMATAVNAAAGWSTTGNAGTDTAINFIGTTNNMPIRFKQNNGWIGQFDKTNRNYFIGSGAGQLIAGGAANVAMGDSAMAKSVNTVANVAIGNNALKENTSGLLNTAIGNAALRNNTTGLSNVAVGAGSLLSHKTGNDNIAIGMNALSSDTSGFNNIAMGAAAMQTSTNATTYIAIGSSALSLAKNGNNKIAVGTSALIRDTSAAPNIAMGLNALAGNISGKSQVAIGANALSTNNGGNNVAVGTASLELNAFSGNNTAVGDSSLRNNLQGDNTAIGAGALYSNTLGIFVTALGSNALRSNTTGFGNTAIGYTALFSNVSGNSNIGIGTSALYLHKTGSSNVAVGNNSMLNDTTGTNNVSIGNNTMENSKSIDHSVAVGNNALQNNKNGSSLVAVGSLALQSDTSGNYNTGIGSASLQANTNGQQNTALGYSAGSANTSGIANLFLGANSNSISGTLVNSTAIGYQSLAAQNNSMVLGSIAGVNSASSSVNVGIGTNTPDARLHIVRNGASGGIYHASAGLILEDNNSSFIQLSNPLASQSGIISGNALTAQRAGIVFEADSSMSFSTGGNTNRVFIGKTGNLGVSQNAPAARLHVVGGSGAVAGGQVNANTVALIENNSFANYLQLLSPVNGDAGVVSGTSATSIRSGLLFNFDSSVRVMTGGGLIRMMVNNTGLVGIRTITPASYLDVAGSVGNAISTATVSTTLDEFDHTHIILPTASGVLITLPAASTCARREYTIVNEDNSVQAISSFIDFTGATSITLLANTSITIQSNGTNWYRTR